MTCEKCGFKLNGACACCSPTVSETEYALLQASAMIFTGQPSYTVEYCVQKASDMLRYILAMRLPK